MAIEVGGTKFYSKNTLVLNNAVKNGKRIGSSLEK